MTNDGILVLQCLGQTIWKFFTSWHIPGTYVTPAAAFLFLLCAVIGLKFFGRVTNMPIDVNIVREAYVARRGDFILRHPNVDTSHRLIGKE